MSDAPTYAMLADMRDRALFAERELAAIRAELSETQKDFMCLAELLDGHDATECRMNLVRLKEQRDEWKAKYIQQNKDLGCEMMDPNGTIWDYAKKVQLELTAMTQQRDELAKALKEIESSNNSQWQSHCAKKAIQSLTPNAKP